jgi:nitroreductase
MNPTLNTIAKRRSVRVFTDRPVSDEDVRKILEAANQAPSAHNQQSWRFMVIEGAAKQGLANLVNSRSDDFPRPSSVLLRMASRSIASAPLTIAVINTGKRIERGTQLYKIDKEIAHDFFRIMEIQSSAAAVQNLLLAATSLGIGTVWLGILILIKDEVLKLLGQPKGEFMAVIPAGYAARSVTTPHKLPLSTIVKHLR